jgi:peptidoglycan DL-endopeptidase CwlO
MGDPTPRWVRRVVVASLVPVGVVAAAPPGFADPGPDPRAGGAPDAGTLPIASAPLVVPPPQAQPAAPAATAMGPLAEQIIAASAATQRLGEQTKALEDELAAARQVTEDARVAWAAAAEALAATQSFGDQVGAPAASDPSSTPAPSALPAPSASPADPSATVSADASVTRAELAQAEQEARTKLDEAIAAEQDVAGRHAVVLEQFQRHSAALQTLTERNNDQLAAAQRSRDEYEASLAASRTAGASVAGLQSAPAALDAVAFALRQLGKPYVWATQGPNTYDCSGLVLASYLSVGIKMPRVANNQYGAGVPVLASQLLPGDLLFFSTNPHDWRQIHHVGIYIGQGTMVHAPTFGDVVKVSPIWWSEYFGATRMVPAMPLPGAPSPTPSPSPSESPSPSPSGSPSPSPSESPSPSPSGSPSPSESPLLSGSPSPTGSLSPSATPSGSASPSAAATAPPDPSPTPVPTPSPSPATSVG